ncbi:alpha/beta-hydrolase [Trichoderma chlorosporum]
MSSVRPPFDPEIVKCLLPAMVDGTLSDSFPTDPVVRLAVLRERAAQFLGAGNEIVNSDPSLESERVTISGPRGEIDILIIRPKGASSTDKRPAIYSIHSGGTVFGDEYTNIHVPIAWMKEVDGVVASVNHRLSPENPGLAPFEDCWEGLVWFAKQSDRFGFDPEKLFVGGVSAGGGLATAAAIMARDKGFPKLCGQILLCPMLDDRATAVSNKQYLHHGPFDGHSDEFNWTCLLGDRRATDNVSIFEAPGRATDLSNLPPAYLEVGSAEPFRDSVVAYASRLWEHGVQAELMVFAGGVHGSDFWAPEASLSKQAVEARLWWLRRRVAELE